MRDTLPRFPRLFLAACASRRRAGRGAAVLPLALVFAMAWHAAAGDAAPVPEAARIRAVLYAKRTAVVSTEIAYPVRKIHREMGQAFQKGDVLVEFTDDLARANLESAKAVLAAASTAFDAASRLFERNNASRVELEMARRDKIQAESRLRAAEYELSCCRIVAPFDGRVAETFVNEFELVGRGAKIVALVDDSRLVARFLLPEEWFGRLAIGQEVGVFIPVAGARVAASVSHLSAVIEPASQTFEAWAELDNAAGGLRAGMNALVTPPNAGAAGRPEG